jgi:endonuclease/exonuclease/phosphatase family metal-dependent hydrolase
MRPRWAITGLGVLALASGIIALLGLRSPDPAPPGATQVTLLHWNMQSGGRRAAEPRWRRAAQQILSRQPDLIVLSEAPPDGWIFDALNTTGGGWRTVHISNKPDQSYWYKPLVASRWPMRLEREVYVRNGAAMAVTVTVRGRPVRLLVVDGLSHVRLLRRPFLEDITTACWDATLRGKPYDIVVGDFNAVGRSIGFESVRSAAGGYRPASDYSRGWRGTWPMPLPVYDIDHVLVGSGVAVTGCDMFSSLTLDTDHRGHFVTLALPPAAEPSP